MKIIALLLMLSLKFLNIMHQEISSHLDRDNKISASKQTMSLIIQSYLFVFIH